MLLVVEHYKSSPLPLQNDGKMRRKYTTSRESLTLYIVNDIFNLSPKHWKLQVAIRAIVLEEVDKTVGLDLVQTTASRGKGRTNGGWGILYYHPCHPHGLVFATAARLPSALQPLTFTQPPPVCISQSKTNIRIVNKKGMFGLKYYISAARFDPLEK